MEWPLKTTNLTNFGDGEMSLSSMTQKPKVLSGESITNLAISVITPINQLPTYTSEKGGTRERGIKKKQAQAE